MTFGEREILLLMPLQPNSFLLLFAVFIVTWRWVDNVQTEVHNFILGYRVEHFGYLCLIDKCDFEDVVERRIFFSYPFLMT